MKVLIKALSKLIETAKILGLSEYDLKNAKDYLMHNEFGLCFDTIVTQIYEYEIEINSDFYQLIASLGEKMKLEYDTYSFVKELIRERDDIAKSLRDEIVIIIASLQS